MGGTDESGSRIGTHPDAAAMRPPSGLAQQPRPGHDTTPTAASTSGRITANATGFDRQPGTDDHGPDRLRSRHGPDDTDSDWHTHPGVDPGNNPGTD